MPVQSTFQKITDQMEVSALGRDARTEFERLFFSHKGAPVEKWRQYLAAYDRHFSPYKSATRAGLLGENRPLRMLEIGVSNGGSLDLWREFFGADAIIYGIDINPDCAVHNGRSGQVRIGSQNDPAFLNGVVDEMGGLDILLDDGSHVAEHQRTSFRTLYPRLSVGGLYAVEDLHTAYWGGYGGGYLERASFIEFLKDVFDQMHGWYADVGDLEGMRLDTSVYALHLYDSIAFIEKRELEPPIAIFARGPTEIESARLKR